MNDAIGIGRYEDTFNPNCTGDFFQSHGVVTILIEAGHYPEDYEREITRYYVYRTLRTALLAIRSGKYEQFPIEGYHKIPENKSRFVDILIRNAHVLSEDKKEGDILGIQYEENLHDARVEFTPRLADTEDLQDHFGHQEWDASNPEHVKELKAAQDVWELIKGHFS